MDPLSDVLSLLKPRSHLSAAIDAGGAWSIRFPSREGIKCCAIVSGRCWLVVEGVPEPVRLETGDCFLIPTIRSAYLTSDPALTPIDISSILHTEGNDRIATINGGGEFFLVGSRFTIAGNQAGILMRMLPPIVHIRERSGRAALRWSVERMLQEVREPQPGGALVSEHLAHLMLVEALRLVLADGAEGGVGWLYALADRQMGAAITSMHEDPAHRWTVQELGERVGMSRSIFALRFKQTVGEPPMEYLTRWRMLLAGDRLEHTTDPVSSIALSLGYESESAFSSAFKRVMGCAPRQYGREQNQPALA